MQYSFVSNYIKNGFDAKHAALDAGYSYSYAHVQAHKLIEQPNIKAYIEKAQNKAISKLSNDYIWKVNKLKRIINEFVPDTGKLGKNAKIAISAMMELNKMHGDYAPQKSMNLNVNSTLERLAEAKKSYDEY